MAIYESDGTDTYLNVPGADWTDERDLGKDIAVTFNVENASFDGDYVIAEVVSSERIRVTPPGPASGFATPATISIVEALGINVLPVLEETWKQFIKVHASVAIRQSRRQESAELNKKLEKYADEVRTSVANRAEEPSQPPLSRGFGAWSDDDLVGY